MIQDSVNLNDTVSGTYLIRIERTRVIKIGRTTTSIRINDSDITVGELTLIPITCFCTGFSLTGISYVFEFVADTLVIGTSYESVFPDSTICRDTILKGTSTIGGTGGFIGGIGTRGPPIASGMFILDGRKVEFFVVRTRCALVLDKVSTVFLTPIHGWITGIAVGMT